jgi:hypothetical protein
MILFLEFVKSVLYEYIIASILAELKKWLDVGYFDFMHELALKG